MFRKCMFAGLFLWVFFAPCAFADIASVRYVQASVETKVDISADANQVMAGTYTVSGELIVPTPPLPPAQ